MFDEILLENAEFVSEVKSSSSSISAIGVLFKTACEIPTVETADTVNMVPAIRE